MSVYWLPFDRDKQIMLINGLIDSIHPFHDEKVILDDIRQNLINYLELTPTESVYLENMIIKYGYLLD
jgi:hypothetical protein